MKLGQEVLNKISDLLVEIDRPKSPKRRTKKTQEFVPQQNNNDDRLYQNYKKMRDRAHDREKDKLKQEMQKLRPFKVDNKHSIFLNSRKNLKPIHQRTTQIIRQKQVSLQKTRAQVERQREMRKKMMHPQEDEELIEEYNRSKSQRRIATKEEMDQILKRLTQRERQRMQKNNRQKMDYLKQKLLNNTQKPYLNKQSQKIWQKMKIQKQLSENVFERFERYNYDRKKSQQKYINKIKQKQTPFRPQISKNSIQILNKSSTSRIELGKDLDRTRSCKCFIKHGQSQRSLYHNHNASGKLNMNTSTNNISSTQSKSRVTLTPNK